MAGWEKQVEVQDRKSRRCLLYPFWRPLDMSSRHPGLDGGGPEFFCRIRVTLGRNPKESLKERNCFRVFS